MNFPNLAPRATSGLVLFVLSALSIPAATAGTMAPWLVDHQLIAPYTPLEIKLGYRDSSPDTRIGAAVLWNDGMENVIDLYNFDADANGVMVDNMFSGVVSGDVFALGEVCVLGDWFLVPYSNNFDLRAIRWNASTFEDIAIDTSAINHTMTDCVVLDGMTAGVAGLDFDNGEMDFYTSFDLGVSWSPTFSYKPSDDDIIGPFSGGFRPKTGPVQLPLAGSVLGINYQRQSGSLESVLLDTDGSILGGPVNYDSFASHNSFIGNGSLKETVGLALDSFGYAFGAANGGSAIGFSWLDLDTGTPDFRLLNPVTTNFLGFQGLGMNYSMEPDTLFIHTFTNRHVRSTFNLMSGTQTFEEIPDYPFADIGGPVGTAFGNDRLYVAAAGFPTGFRGGQPGFMIATMNPDSSVMQGEPLGGIPGGPGGEAFSVPAVQRGGLILLALLMTGLVWLRMRT